MEQRTVALSLSLDSGPLSRECWQGLELSLHTAWASGAWHPASCTFLAWNPYFSEVLEKQKSAKGKAARQSVGTGLLEGVGTVPAEVAGCLPPPAGLGSPCRKGL